MFGWQNTWLFIGVNSWYRVGFGTVRRSTAKQSPSSCFYVKRFVLKHSHVSASCSEVQMFTSCLSTSTSFHKNIADNVYTVYIQYICFYLVCVVCSWAEGCFPRAKNYLKDKAHPAILKICNKIDNYICTKICAAGKGHMVIEILNTQN